MSIVIFDIPTPVIVIENGEKKEGYVIYVESGKQWDNDIWCIALSDGGHVRHYLSNQIRIFKNSTLGITDNKDETR